MPNELSPGLAAILKNLPKETVEKLLSKLTKNRSSRERKPKYKTKRISILHNYNCEVCGTTHTKTFAVKVTASMEGLDLHRKPLELYHICEQCKKKIILGLALATMMVEGKITHSVQQ